ncbi:hypothetical protein N2152v2_003937 [Parachlorella kessleri]
MAARLRDQIKELESSDPVSSLHLELKRAIQAERYEVGVPVRVMVLDAVRMVAFAGVSEGFLASKPQDAALLQSKLAEVQQASDTGQHLAQMPTRSEALTDGIRVQVERGEGVVGRKPELAPGQSFFYQATCPLSSSLGSMQGHYEMYVKSDSGQWTRSFLAKIETFALDSSK